MNLILILIMATAVFVVFFVFRKSRSRGEKPSKSAASSRSTASGQAPAQPSEYRSIAVECDASGCSEAQALKGRRFLTGEAPKLPLPGCDVVNCSCKYVHFTDRRDEDSERRSVNSLQSNLHALEGSSERRDVQDRPRGRRTSDE